MATSNEKQVQLKREMLLNDEAILEEVFPKTMTDAVIDTNSGLKLSEVIDTILTAINNKVSRNVNSVNGRSGVVLLDASDVGLGNVDNVSTADIKAWIIKPAVRIFQGLSFLAVCPCDSLCLRTTVCTCISCSDS